MTEVNSSLSFYVPGGEFEAGDAALVATGQVRRAEQIVVESSRLKCCLNVAGGACRITTKTEIDPEHSSIVNITVSCPISSKQCSHTCDGFIKYLKSDWAGSLSIAQQIAFID